MCHNHGVCTLEAMLHSKRNHHSEKLLHCREEEPPLAATREKSSHSNGDLVRPKINLKRKTTTTTKTLTLPGISSRGEKQLSQLQKLHTNETANKKDLPNVFVLILDD